MIRSASLSGASEVEVPRLSVIPRSLVNPDFELRDDAYHWINKCWAQYFGLKSIKSGLTSAVPLGLNRRPN